MIVIFFLLIIVVFAFLGFQIIKPDEVGLVFTLGKYQKVYKPGLVFVIPFLQIIKSILEFGR